MAEKLPNWGTFQIGRKRDPCTSQQGRRDIENSLMAQPRMFGDAGPGCDEDAVSTVRPGWTIALSHIGLRIVNGDEAAIPQGDQKVWGLVAVRSGISLLAC